MNKDQCCNHDCNQGRGCPVRAGTHKPAEALHQLQEPSTEAQEAWRAGIDEGREQMQGSVSNATLADEREAFEKWADARKEDSIYLPKFSDGTYIYDDTHAAWEAWHARAALAATPADHVADAGKMVAAASRTTGYVAPKGRYVPPVLFSPYTGEPRDARDIASDPQGVLIVPPGALLTASSKPAAETVVLPEPFTTLVRKTSWSSDCYEASPRSNAQEYGRQWADERINVYTEQQVRALLATATGLPAQAVASIYVTEDGQRECDDWKVPLPVGRNLLYAAPQAQADARDAAQEKPPAGRYVLAWMEGKEIPIRAMWVPKSWLVAGDECPEGWAEYDEDKDEYYCPDGWYEANEHEETHWHVSTPIVAWVELPRRATIAAQAAQGGE